MDEGLNRPVSKKITNLRPALAFLKPYKMQVFWASIALVMTAGVTLSIGQGIRIVIDEGLSYGSSEILSQSIVFFAALVGVLTAGTFIRFYFVSWVGERVSADIRKEVFSHLIFMHPGFFEENLPTEIQSRITTDTTLLQTVIGSSVSIALRNILMFVGGLVLLFVTNAKLSLVVIASFPFVVLPIVLFGRRVRNLSRSSQDTLADVGTQAGESLRNIKIVQSFNHEDHDVKEFDRRVTMAFDVAIRRIKQRSFLIALVMMLVLGAIATMLWIGGNDVLLGRISPGELAAFIFYAFMVAGSVGAISEVYSDLQRAAGATERLVELLHAPNQLIEPLISMGFANEFTHSLRVKKLSFSYPLREDVKVLREATFDVRKGEMVALVGPSGAGKSTLFDLLQRFYDPDAGEIFLNGTNLSKLKLQEIRERIGFVPQDPVLFSGSIRANITYGAPACSSNDIREVLSLAHAEEFIHGMPNGLDTIVGEGGTGLSGGQRQRLAIARALLKKPDVLLLDEATSALDAESEEYIRESIQRLKGSCSILVIAHRLSTVRQADRILVIADGFIQGEGSHDQLIETNALYAKFAEIQFSDGGLSAGETRTAG